MNRKILYAHRSIAYAAQGRASALEYAQKAKSAYDQIGNETDYYNNVMAEGKWKNMMSANPHPQPVFKMPAVATTQPLGESGVGVAIEGQGFAQTAKSSSNQLPQFSEFVPTRRFIDLFNTGGGAVDWSATATEPWIRLSSSAGHLTSESASGSLWMPRLHRPAMRCAEPSRSAVAQPGKP